MSFAGVIRLASSDQIIDQRPNADRRDLPAAHRGEMTTGLHHRTPALEDRDGLGKLGGGHTQPDPVRMESFDRFQINQPLVAASTSVLLSPRAKASATSSARLRGSLSVAKEGRWCFPSSW